MPRRVERALSPLKVKSAGVGMHCDGGGLYLQVTASRDKQALNRSWVFRYTVGGKLRDMGIGPISTIGLSEARERARVLRMKRLDGIDPIEERKAARAKPVMQSITFQDAARSYIAEREDTWKSAVHREQWRTTIRDYATPVIGKMSVSEIDTPDVTRVLDPIWREKPETASRLRARIEAILSWAKVRRMRDGENPARWRGHLDHIYPSPAAAAKAARTRRGRGEHHPALPYTDLGQFMAELRDRSGCASRALEFVILTAARTGEVLGAKWDEVDLRTGTWTVPAGRMKAAKEHRVPLSPRAQTILNEMEEVRQSEYVFPGDSEGKPLSNMALLSLLRRMKRDGVTVHGFRSTFRDWCAEQTNFPREIAEAALAHVLESKVEAAYQRGDLLEKRRKMMEAWGQFCETSYR